MSYCSEEEFDNILRGRAASQQVEVFKQLRSDCESADFLSRRALFAEYYKIPETSVDALYKIPPQERREACWEQGVNPYLFRALFDYNAYESCFDVFDYLRPRLDFREISVLDYGCSVSDYGFFFGKLGSKITICDFREQMDFASFRLTRHDIPHTAFCAPVPYPDVTRGVDLAIFSEVLEHLNDPLDMLRACLDNGVSYIFSTCYPYGDDNYFAMSGHSAEAKRQVPDALELLRSNCHEVGLGRKRRMWVRK